MQTITLEAIVMEENQQISEEGRNDQILNQITEIALKMIIEEHKHAVTRLNLDMNR